VGPPPPGATRGLGAAAFRCQQAVYAPQGRLSTGSMSLFIEARRRGILRSSRLQAGADLGSKAAARSTHYPYPPGLRSSS
jgi:hypothetical protein